MIFSTIINTLRSLSKSKDGAYIIVQKRTQNSTDTNGQHIKPLYTLRELERMSSYTMSVALMNHILNREEHLAHQLLDAGADVDHRDRFGYTALHSAAMRGSPSICRHLIELGSNVNAVSLTYQRTPLHSLATNGTVDVCGILLDAGADINALDRKNNTPLHVAVQCGSLKLAKVLLEFGADKTITNVYGELPWDILSSHPGVKWQLPELKP